MHVAEITDPLISVAGMCDAGFQVFFDKNGGRVRHVKSGRVIPLPRVGNCYVMDMHIPAKAEEEEEEKGSEGGSASAFQRPESALPCRRTLTARLTALNRAAP